MSTNDNSGACSSCVAERAAACANLLLCRAHHHPLERPRPASRRLASSPFLRRVSVLFGAAHPSLVSNGIRCKSLKISIRATRDPSLNSGDRTPSICPLHRPCDVPACSAKTLPFAAAPSTQTAAFLSALPPPAYALAAKRLPPVVPFPRVSAFRQTPLRWTRASRFWQRFIPPIQIREGE
jgi:hypothetical protein